MYSKAVSEDGNDDESRKGIKKTTAVRQIPLTKLLRRAKSTSVPDSML